MGDELIIAVILTTIIVVFAGMTVIYPNNKTCNADVCMIDYYIHLQSDPRDKI